MQTIRSAPVEPNELHVIMYIWMLFTFCACVLFLFVICFKRFAKLSSSLLILIISKFFLLICEISSNYLQISMNSSSDFFSTSGNKLCSCHFQSNEIALENDISNWATNINRKWTSSKYAKEKRTKERAWVEKKKREKKWMKWETNYSAIESTYHYS